MKSFALLLLLGCCSTLAVDAQSNNETVVKAKNKFHSYQSGPVELLRGIDAGEYDQIYIQYHQCVWSEFVDGDDGEDSGCQGDGDGDSWYMGNTQCYRANAAYSLYGVQAGDDIPSNACRKQHYINSFFTKNGMQDLGSLLGLEYYDEASSQCTMVQNDNEDNNNNNNNNSFQHNVQLYPNAQSYTTYCASGKFVTAKFSGAYCTGQGELELMDTLTELNDELDEAGCFLAYSTYGYSDDAYVDDQNARKLSEDGSGDEGEDEGEEEENEEEENKTIWDLLAYSDSCSTVEYPKGCPDPYGAKRKFDLNPSGSSWFSTHMYAIDWITLVLFVLGTFLLTLTCCIKDNENRKKKRFVFRRGRSKSPLRNIGRKSGNSESGDTVTSSGENANRKKRGIRGFFSRKK